MISIGNHGFKKAILRQVLANSMFNDLVCNCEHRLTVESPIRMRQKYTRVNIHRCANFSMGKQMAHANTNTHRSIFTYGLIYSRV